MKKRIIAISLLLCLLAGCASDGPLSSDDAQQVVMEHLGVSSSQVSDIHVHLEESDDGAVCYSIHITAKGKTYTYVVHSVSGEILSIEEGSSH